MSKNTATSIGGDALNRDDDVAREAAAPAPSVSVLAKVHALPRTQRQAAVRDRYVEGSSNNRALAPATPRRGKVQSQVRQGQKDGVSKTCGTKPFAVPPRSQCFLHTNRGVAVKAFNTRHRRGHKRKMTFVPAVAGHRESGEERC